MRRTPGCSLLPVLALLLCSGSDVLSGRTNVLLNGDVSPVESPLPYWFDTDFTVTYSMIPTNDQLLDQEAVRRYTRLYTPRTQEQMDAYDAIFHVEADFSVFTARQLEIFRQATLSRGKPALCSPPFDDPYTHSWVNSFMVEMSPHDHSGETGDLSNILIDGDVWSVVVSREERLAQVLTMFDGFGLEKSTGTSHIALYPKPGATVWAKMKGASDPAGRTDPPFMLSWRWGTSLVWVVAQDYDRDWWGVESGLFGWDQRKNPVSPDIVLNMLYFSTGRDLPEDITVIHTIRTVYRSLSDSRGLLVSLFEFIQRFGAKTYKLEAEVEGIRALEKQAELLFEEGHYDASLFALRNASTRYVELGSDAMKLKNEALFWVYVIEWSIVLSSCMISGSILYALMIRRTLYRETSTTRSSRDSA